VKALPGLIISGARWSRAEIELIEQPEELGLMSLPYRDLEDTNLPLILLSDEYHLRCSSAMLTGTSSSGFGLHGNFELAGGSSSKPNELRYKLPRHMKVTGPGAVCMMQKRGFLSGPFQVKVGVTGRPYELIGSPIPFLPEQETTSEPPVNSKSMLARFSGSLRKLSLPH
jgi:hypothetical protein